MIRILQVIDNMNAGGMENMIMNYYRNINRNEIQFDFLIFSKDKCLYEDEIISMGGQIFKITPRRKSIIKNRKELNNFFRNCNYEIAEFHQGITYYYPLKQAKRYGIKHRIIHNHGINRNYLKYLKLYNECFAKKRITNLATDYFSCSTSVNNHIFTDKVINEKKVIIIHNAIDIEKFKYSNINRQEIRKEFNICNNEILIGHIGTFTKPKNHKFILKVFNEYLKRNKNAKLLLVGTGPLKDEIENEIKFLKMEDNVLITENRKDVNKILSAIDFMLFPSIYEGIPLVLIEAQANGVPAFISNNIDKESILLDNVERLFLEQLPSYWAQKIYEFNKENNRETYFKKMLKGRYNIKNQAKEIECIYKRMR